MVEEIKHWEDNGKDEKITKSCPSCNGLNLVTDYKHGELVCKNCGLVIDDELLDFGPEWRAFDEEQKSKRSRTGSPVKYAKLNKGLTTEIDRYERD
ncbi:MAG: TFIIB-type zinc ribbon-containing protein, partial [Candidatus Altiarchaeota archaeon]|nr:TFIIB-type zinc ribbon-containing protein [Candidatus Altiarchaeota archaeon]